MLDRLEEYLETDSRDILINTSTARLGGWYLLASSTADADLRDILIDTLRDT